MEKTKIIILVLFLTVLSFRPIPSHAQGKAYLIGINDVLTVTIYAGGIKQNEVKVTVSAKGTINAPFIGSVKAAGLTPGQLEERMIKPLTEDYFVNPKVNIQIENYRSQYYYISGAVKSPGLYYLTTEATLMVLIAEAGGVTPERGNQAHIMRQAGAKAVAAPGVQPSGTGKKTIRVNLQELLEKGDFSTNPVLYPGDVVYIPLKESVELDQSKIYLEGEIKEPGAYDFKAGMTALNACIMAGGFSMYAAPNRARIIRKIDDKLKIIKINLKDVKNGKIPDIELKAGDRIHIPETWI